MDAETQGIVGAIIGLGLGIVDYFILSRLLERGRLEKQLKPEQAKIISVAITVTGFILFPILGYYIGRYVLA